MPSWLLTCPGCNQDFEHSAINDANYADSVLPKRPAVPVTGSELQCPHCKGTSVYYSFDLRYGFSRR
jgi:hypothetical protein